MKQFLFTCTMLWLLCHTVWAQTEAGNTLIGGQIQFRGRFVENENGGRIFGYAFAPYAGYFIKGNLTLGGGISFSKQKIEFESSNYKSINRDLSVFAASRYYISIGEAKKFYAYLQGALEYSWGKTEISNPLQEIVIQKYTLSIAPGFAYFPSQHWGLELGFSGLASSIVDRKGHKNYSSVTLGTDSFSPSLGVGYYF